jgi:hypothetical protein
MPHDHPHTGHEEHEPHAPVGESHGVREDSALMERALREILIENGAFTAADIQRQIEATESRSPELGAKVVARAWVDPE